MWFYLRVGVESIRSVAWNLTEREEGMGAVQELSYDKRFYETNNKGTHIKLFLKIPKQWVPWRYRKVCSAKNYGFTLLGLNVCSFIYENSKQSSFYCLNYFSLPLKFPYKVLLDSFTIWLFTCSWWKTPIQEYSQFVYKSVV